jgi:hypothetical protein
VTTREHPDMRELRRQVREGWPDDEILDAWRKRKPGLLLRDERRILLLAAELRGQPPPERQLARDHALTQAEARALVERYGSLRKAEANSNWSASHIARVKNGERGKRSI